MFFICSQLDNRCPLCRIISSSAMFYHLYGRRLFWNGPQSFEPRSDDEGGGRWTPELAPERDNVWPLRMILRATGPKHGGSSMESGFEPGTLRSRSRELSTVPTNRKGGQRSVAILVT
ncbi:hypothetical protein AVEN_239241-1 [Araneus ventricosus]|uniref:Uncharacterized protein n=1 Tax=Araneus ventricosus TaxID=182803 RepID=A0A4Y2J7G8_ARAVE|nr:hypothetical protein AVEN_239241-1 [Araneus ventricosus]